MSNINQTGASARQAAISVESSWRARFNMEIVATVALLALLWEVLPRIGIIPRLFLPALSDVMTAGWAGRKLFLDALAMTTVEVLSALAITLLFGIVIGLFIGSIRALHGLLAVASAAYAIPVIALYPLLCVWLGFGSEPSLLLGVFMGIIPVILIVGEAIRLVDSRLTLLARAFGANRRQSLFKLYLPATLPALITAIRVGSGLVIIGVVVGQMLLSSQGIGYLITYYRTSFDPASLYFGVLLVVVIVVAVDRMIALVLRLPMLADSGKTGPDAQHIR